MTPFLLYEEQPEEPGEVMVFGVENESGDGVDKPLENSHQSTPSESSAENSKNPTESKRMVCILDMNPRPPMWSNSKSVTAPPGAEPILATSLPLAESRPRSRSPGKARRASQDTSEPVPIVPEEVRAS